ncbi:Ig-like domain-containing protein [Achromobacter sp. NPDC058515]|uniref:Ig-like domain-containing protein n=1 Tax=Achromobacter sp. NPDC058515 TaxID=3346533 RepID=UPI0036527B3E
MKKTNWKSGFAVLSDRRSFQLQPLETLEDTLRVPAIEGGKYVFTEAAGSPLGEDLAAARSADDLYLSLRSAGWEKPVAIVENFYAKPGDVYGMDSDGAYQRVLSADASVAQGPVAVTAQNLGSWHQQQEAVALHHVRQSVQAQASPQANPAAVPDAGIPAAADAVSPQADPGAAQQSAAPSPAASFALEITHIVDNVSLSGEVRELGTNAITDDNQPEIFGTGPAGARLEILDGSVVIGSVTVGVDGTWSLAPDIPFSEAGHILSLRDAATGQTSSSNFIFIVDTIAPASTSIASVSENLANPQGEPIPEGGSTRDNTPTISGQAEPNALITIYNFGVAMAAISSDVRTGAWSWTPPFPLPDGQYKFSARASDFVGNGSLMSRSYAITIDTIPVPSATPTILSITDDTGSSATDFVTKDDTLLVRVQVAGDLNRGEVVQVSMDNGATWGNATQQGNQWVYDNTANALAEGERTLQARVVNTKGEPGPIASQDIVIDMTGPRGGDYEVSIQVYGDDAGPKQGEFGSGTVTDDTSPLLKGTVKGLQPGDEVHIYAGGQYVGKAEADGAGGWTYPLSGLAEGSYSYTAVIVDKAGNLGETSSAFGIVVDLSAPKTAPTISEIYDDILPSAGWLKSGATTDDVSPHLRGKNAVPNGLVNIYDNGKLIGQAKADAGGNWDYDTQQNNVKLASGLHALTARNVSAAGTEGPQSSEFDVRIEVASTTNSNTPYSGLGWDLKSAGDFNGDGIEDFIVSAPANQYDHKHDIKGSNAYLVYGTTAGLPSFENGIERMTAGQGIKLDGSGLTAGDNAKTGLYVKGGGDFNGDGYDDIIVGSHLEDGAHVIYGRGDKPGTLYLKPAYDGASTYATRIGWGSAWVGADAAFADVNGDGYDDLLVTDSHEGETHIIYGGENAKQLYGGHNLKMPAGNPTITDMATGKPIDPNAYTTFRGTVATGSTMNAVGDVNGDGIVDFVIAAPRETAFGMAEAGNAYLVFGQRGGFAPTMELKDIRQYGVLLQGTEVGEQLGDVKNDMGKNAHGNLWFGSSTTVSTLGDINGDGVADFIIGSPGWGDKRLNDANSPGRAYVIYGKRDQNWSDIDLSRLNGVNGFVLNSNDMGYAQLGSGVSGGFDFNADGIDDFLVGAPNATINGGTCAGAAYLVYGQKGGGFSANTNLDTLVSQGRAIKWTGLADDRLGSNTAMGDWNGDGVADIAIPSWESDAGGNDAGSYKIYYGETAELTQGFTGNADVIGGVDGAVDRIAGGGGDDIISGIGRDDVVYAGAGDDRITVDQASFVRVDGGLGVDTLVFGGSNQVFNLSQAGESVRGIEQFDLGSGNNRLQLSQNDVARLGEVGLVTSSGKVQLLVEGGSDVKVDLLTRSGADQWLKLGTHTLDGDVFDVYTDAARTIEAFVPQNSAQIVFGAGVPFYLDEVLGDSPDALFPQEPESVADLIAKDGADSIRVDGLFPEASDWGADDAVAADPARCEGYPIDAYVPAPFEQEVAMA